MKRMKSAADVRLVLQAQTAADLMTPNPVSIRDTATLADAVALLTDKGFSGAPVIDEAGHPIGVVSRADIVAHDRELPNAAVAASASGTAVDSRRRVRDLVVLMEATKMAMSSLVSADRAEVLRAGRTLDSVRSSIQ